MDAEEKTIGEKLSALDYQPAHDELKVSDTAENTPAEVNIKEPVFEFVGD